MLAASTQRIATQWHEHIYTRSYWHEHVRALLTTHPFFSSVDVWRFRFASNISGKLISRRTASGSRWSRSNSEKTSIGITMLPAVNRLACCKSQKQALSYVLVIDTTSTVNVRGSRWTPPDLCTTNTYLVSHGSATTRAPNGSKHCYLCATSHNPFVEAGFGDC